MAPLEKLLFFLKNLLQIKLSSGALRNTEILKMQINIKTIYNRGQYTKTIVLKYIIESEIQFREEAKKAEEMAEEILNPPDQIITLMPSPDVDMQEDMETEFDQDKTMPITKMDGETGSDAPQKTRDWNDG